MSTLNDVIALARTLTDTSGSANPSDSEMLQLARHHLAFEHGELVNLNQNYAVTSSIFTMAASATTAALPSDLFKILGINKLFDGSDVDGRMVALEPFSFQEQPPLAGTYSRIDYGLVAPRYRQEGRNIKLLPKAVTEGTYVVYYVPVVDTTLSASTDIPYPWSLNGWHKLIALGVARDVMNKLDRDPSEMINQYNMFLEHVRSVATPNDASGKSGFIQTSGDWLYTDDFMRNF